MGSAPDAGRAFFPLDEELELIGKLTPHAHESLVRFGTILPFRKAAKELAFILKVEVSEPTVRRYVEAAGQAYVDYQTEEVERLEKDCPPVKAGSSKMFLSADGAMIPLVGGEWAEVKTLTIGEIDQPVFERGEWNVHSKNHSYFSRMAESSLFRRLALVETHLRGIEKAKIVAAVTDGAEWEQGFIDFHCPQAVRILDFPHAADHVSQIGQALWGEASEQTQKWLGDQLHQLKHEGPCALLSELTGLKNQTPHLDVLQKNQAYLEKRADHMHYPEYRTQHLPIASGAMESGNKLVVQARLKGAGMHWAVPHVNPMLALRNLWCSERWQAGRQQITLTMRQQERQQRSELHQKHKRKPHNEVPPPTLVPLHVYEIPASPKPVPASTLPSQPNLPHPSSIPAPNHPWRRSPIGKAKFLRPPPFTKN